MIQKVKCHCDKELELDIPEMIDLDSKADLVSTITSGQFLASICGFCGATVRPECQLELRWSRFERPIWLVPEMDRALVLHGKSDAPKSHEILVGYAELIERVNVLRSDLDPKTVEVIKYYLQSKAEETDTDGEITVLFGGLDTKRLQFRVSGYKSGETGLLHIAMEKYLEIKADFKRLSLTEPFKMIFSGGYQSIRKAAVLET